MAGADDAPAEVVIDRSTGAGRGGAEVKGPEAAAAHKGGPGGGEATGRRQEGRGEAGEAGMY